MTKLESIRIGVIGLGCRGSSMLPLLLMMEDVRVPAVCDLYPDRMQAGVDKVAEAGQRAQGYTDYRELLARDDLDAVMISTSWTSHIEIAVAAMNAGIAVAMEVGGASSIQECWDLVRAHERTGVPVMLLENCCYGRDEMMVLNMVKQGVFGEIIHCQGGYEHDLRDEVSLGGENRHYRLRNYLNRNGELYPTHELGPIAKVLDINRGNRFLTLSSMASKARGAHAWIAEHRSDDPELMGAAFTQGDVVTTQIKCAHGETILLVHDTTLPRPYSRGGRVQGTKGLWMEDKNGIYVEGRSPAHTWESVDDYREQYDHPLWKRYLQEGVKAGHDGMDYLELRAFVESMKAGVKPPIDVYDAAAWMAVTCLSEQSVAMGGAPVPVPDFTDGKWIRREKDAPSLYALDDIHDL